MKKKDQTCALRATLKLAVTAFWLLAATARAEQFAIQLDQVIAENVPGPGAGVIPAYNANDVYAFQATNGQIVFLEEIAVASTFQGWLYWDLVSPGNVSLSSGYFQGTHEGRRVLPETGTYKITVRVTSNNPAHTGTYSFRVRSVAPDPLIPVMIGSTVSNGVPVAGAGNIEMPGAHDVYRFNANAGDLAFFERLKVSAAFAGWLQWELKSPGGQVLFRTYFGSGHDGRKTLPETGAYTLRVSDGTTTLSHVGDYAFRLRPIPPDQTFPIEVNQWITNGTPAAGAGNIEVAGSWDYYTFQGTAGQSLFFHDAFAAASLGGWLQWETKTPSGQTLFSSFFGGGSAGRKTLPETGKYTVRCWVGSNEPNHTGAYSFRITSADDAQFAIRIGDVVTNGVPAAGAGNIETAGGQDLYTFNGTAGQKVVFEELFAATAFAGWLRLEVKTPGSNELFAAYFQPGRKREIVLPETGAYRARVYAGASNPNYVGPYSFRSYSPVRAWPDQFAVSPGVTLAIPKAKFLCNDTCEAVDTLSVDLPGSSSTGSGILSNNVATVYYTPAAGFTGVDAFTYRLRGQFGGEATQQVTVRVHSGADTHATVVSVVRTGGNNVQVCLLGAPGQTYLVEQSPDLANWAPFGNLTADSAGAMTFNYAAAPGPDGFYRFRKP